MKRREFFSAAGGVLAALWLPKRATPEPQEPVTRRSGTRFLKDLDPPPARLRVRIIRTGDQMVAEHFIIREDGTEEVIERRVHHGG